MLSLLVLLVAVVAGTVVPYRHLGQYEVTGLGLDCRYLCDDPVCHPLCAPGCRDPVCDVQCGMNAPILCNAIVPSCSVRCPYDAFTPMVADMCPACETVCNALPATCESTCSILCEAPECGWQCRLPVECALPRCELQCEAPACQVPGTATRLVGSVLLLLVFIVLFQ